MREITPFGPVVYFGPGACITCGRAICEPYNFLHTSWCVDVRAENIRLRSERGEIGDTNLSSDFQALVAPTFLNTG